jgi:hypothetical protein
MNKIKNQNFQNSKKIARPSLKKSKKDKIFSRRSGAKALLKRMPFRVLWRPRGQKWSALGSVLALFYLSILMFFTSKILNFFK